MAQRMTRMHTDPMTQRRSLRVQSMAAILAAALLASACASARPTARMRSTATSLTATPNSSPTPRPLPTWTTVATVSPHVGEPAFAPSDPHIAYQCVYDVQPGTGGYNDTVRLYTSTDGGQNWQRDAAAPTFDANTDFDYTIAGCDIFINATDARDVFLQVQRLVPEGATTAIPRLYRSRDGGASWQQLTEIDGMYGFTSLAVLGSRLIAVPRPNIYGASPCNPTIKPAAGTALRASDDGGITWHEIGQPIESQNYSPGGFAIAGGTLFTVATAVPAAACTGDYPTTTLWRSSDSGDTWAQVTVPAPGSAAPYGVPTFIKQATGSGVYGILLTATFDPPTSSNVAAVLPMYSSDSGATWSSIPFPSALDVSPYSPATYPAVVTPTGAVVMTRVCCASLSSALYVWRPGATSWQLYAEPPPNGGGTMREIVTSQGAFLWNYTGDTVNGVQIMVLPLP